MISDTTIKTGDDIIMISESYSYTLLDQRTISQEHSMRNMGDTQTTGSAISWSHRLPFLDL